MKLFNQHLVSYIEQVVKNAKAMAKVFEGTAIRAISGGTDNHLLLLDIKETGLNGKEAQELLDTVGITVNKNAIPFDTLPPVKTKWNSCRNGCYYNSWL